MVNVHVLENRFSSLNSMFVTKRKKTHRPISRIIRDTCLLEQDMVYRNSKINCVSIRYLQSILLVSQYVTCKNRTQQKI